MAILRFFTKFLFRNKNPKQSCFKCDVGYVACTEAGSCKGWC